MAKLKSNSEINKYAKGFIRAFYDAVAKTD